MKNIKYLSLLFVGLLVAACGDPELRFQPFEETEHGAFARRLALSGAFVFNDPAGSNFTGTVEFYDENNGQDVASYSWTVEFRANGGGNGGVDIPAVTFLTIPSSSFTTNADGLPEVSFALNMQASMDALGLTIADITGGDQFRFNATVTKTDGTSYGFGNTGPNLVSQPPFSALVRVNANIVCTSDIGGALTYSTTNMVLGQGGSPAIACAGTVTGTDAFTDQGGGVYGLTDLTWGQFGHCWADTPGDGGSNTMVDVCNMLDYGDGPDQYGDTYSLTNLAVSGASMTFDWVNTFGDGGTTTVTRTDGANWPPLTSN